MDKKDLNHTAQAGFINLTLLGIIVAVLLFTGLGQYIWHNTLQLGSTCHSISRDISAQQYMGDMCDSLGLALASFRNRMEQWVGMNTDGLDLEMYAGQMARQFSSATLGGFNAPSLNGLTSGNGLLPQSLQMGSYGNRLLSAGDISGGLPYLQRSASMGEYGLLSQLSLGSAYLNGTGGLPQNPDASYQYNSMALTSINRLEAAGTPEADRLLQALPKPPGEMKRTLSDVMGALR